MDDNYVSRLDNHMNGNAPEGTPEADPSPAQRRKKVTAKSIVIMTLISMVVALGGGIAFFIIGRLGNIFLSSIKFKLQHFHLEHNNHIFALSLPENYQMRLKDWYLGDSDPLAE